MKVGHFNTAFRASLFLLVSLCSSFALSDGTCYLTQYANGEYVIRCEGDGIWINYVDHTNEVYIIENCETLKANLLAAVDDINDGLFSINPYLESILNSAEQIYYSSSSDSLGLYIRSQVGSITNDVNSIKASISDVSNGLVGGATSTFTPLRSQIEAIQCGSCSTNNSGSCCDVDLTPILQKMNEAQNLRSLVNSNLLFISNAFRRISPLYYQDLAWLGKLNDMSIFDQPTYFAYDEYNVLSLLSSLQNNLAVSQFSINNYLYDITQNYLPVISNNLEIVMSTTTNFYNAATNHFSLFRKITFQDSPLIDYSQQSTFNSYYDFLTNHYVKVSFKQYNSLVGDEKAKTNWFSRIETLLAALVFNDSEGTNTVDDTYGQSQQDNLINSLDGMNHTSATQVNLMSSMGDSLLASLRSLNSSFSSAVSMPGEVKLATISHNNGMVTQTIKFQSSEISQLVEACRCATTLAWCFGGIWLLFLFVSWSVKTSYSLCVFCWSIVSAIFGGGKT